MNNKDTILEQLRSLGLGHYEAQLYIELLKEPSTHLKLAHATGINRTKVYRLIDELEKLSLITKRTDDRGTFLVAAEPRALEIALVTSEQVLLRRRTAFEQVLPSLQGITKGDGQDFIIHTYDGVEGFKLMLWHELKAQNEVLVLGRGALEEFVPDKRWAEKHRKLSLEAGYTIRELLNPREGKSAFTSNSAFMNIYQERYISEAPLMLQHQIVIYNDIVATYHWRDGKRVGFEVINKSYATMMRQVFEHYWQFAEPADSVL